MCGTPPTVPRSWHIIYPFLPLRRDSQECRKVKVYTVYSIEENFALLVTQTTSTRQRQKQEILRTLRKGGGAYVQYTPSPERTTIANLSF